MNYVYKMAILFTNKKYRDLLPSSDEVARWKQDEIDMEDRRIMNEETDLR